MHISRAGMLQEKHGCVGSMQALHAKIKHGVFLQGEALVLTFMAEL